MEKLKMHSLSKIDENVKKIAALFPECITEIVNDKGELEKVVDIDAFRQLFSKTAVEGNQERYQFTWPDKRKAKALVNQEVTSTLRPCREESVNFDTTENLYIEGDNLEVLKLLQETYLGKIKLIYIDPPYNTGGDFLYEDNFTQDQEEYIAGSGQYDEQGNRLVVNPESNGRFHTNWLNMVYSRLLIARDLLRDDGAILINMDENEIANLLKICNEIFGENNDLGTIIWDKRNPKGDATGISIQHEYICCYAKDRLTFSKNNKLVRPKKNAETMLRKASQLFKKLGPSYTLEQINEDFSDWIKKQTDLSGGERAYNKIDENGDVYRPVSMAWPNLKKAPDDYFIPLIHPITGKPCPVPARGWRNPSATMRKLQEAGLILFGKDETTIPNSKYLLKENKLENVPSLIYFGGSDTDLLASMNIPFDTPKVVSICMEHILSFTADDDLVLDFFSGSATTAHAVLKVNAENNSHRKFIMVQLPENCDEKSEAYKAGFKNICELGKERIRRAGKQILEEMRSKNGELFTEESTLDVGFRDLKLDSSNMNDVYYTPDETDQRMLDGFVSNIKDDRTAEDLLFQVMLDLGVLLSAKIVEEDIGGKKVFNVDDNYLIACFDENVDENVIVEAAKKKPTYFVMRDSSLANDSVSVNFDQIFARYSPDTVRKVL